ncbi:MAG TPA: hemin uptake protein HemP [Gammaproteobacteria bacterium]|nr:hemin uptake protein HemP [Gammaproteobacteria bacterium]
MSPVSVSTEALFGAAKEVLIRHGETVYRLRITSKDKLILTK